MGADVARPSESRWSLPHLGRWAARVLLAGVVLGLAELIWLSAIDFEIKSRHVLLTLATTTSLVALCELAVGALVALSRSLLGRRAPLLLAAFSLPAVMAATRSLTSGGFISDVSGITAIRLGMGSLLVASVWCAARLYSVALVTADTNSRRRWLGLTLLLGLVASWADANLQRGLYPAFHLVLAVGLIAAATLAARLILVRTVPRVVGLGSLLALVLCVPVVGSNWSSFEAESLAVFSPGLIPKVRETAVAALAWGDRSDDRLPVESVADLADLPGEESGGDVPWLAPQPLNLLAASHGFDDERWHRGGQRAEVLADDALGPDGSLTADRVAFGADISTLVQDLDVPVRGKTFEASLWVRRLDGPLDGTLDIMFMIGRKGLYGRRVLTPVDEWTEVVISHSFADDGPDGPLTLRIGNDHSQPTALVVALADGKVVEQGATALEGASVGGGSSPLSLSGGTNGGGQYSFRPSTSAEVTAVRRQTRNVIFVLMDAFRNDHLGLEVEGASITPHMDALAKEALRFSTCYSPSDHTGRSMPSLMTSLPVDVVKRSADQDVPLQTWIDALADRGLRTFHNGSDYVSRKFEHLRIGYGFGAEEHGTINPKAEGLVDEVLEFAARGGAPFAAYTHWSDVHIPPRREDMAATYREKVGVVDDRVGALVAGLKQLGVWEETLLVLTSDHGYSLGEDNRFLGGQGCQERSLRVPLLLHIPGANVDGVSADGLVSGLALVPTILDALAPDSRMIVADESLLRLLPEPGSAWAGRDAPIFATTGDADMVRLGRWKLASDRSRRTALLFDPAADPGDRQPVNDPEQVEIMKQLLVVEQARQRELSTALVAVGRQDLDLDMVELLTADEIDLGRIRQALDGLWSRPAPTRTFLLETVFIRRLKVLRPSLVALTRESWEDHDQALLVLRAWAGEEAGGAELADRLAELGSVGRHWLGELIGALPDDVVESLAKPLTAQLMTLHGSGLVVGSEDDRFVTLAAFGLSQSLEESTPREIKLLLRDVYNRNSAMRPMHRMSTLLIKSFTPAAIVTRLGRIATEDDLDLMLDLRMEYDSAAAIARLCGELGSARGRDVLLATLARSDLNEGQASVMAKAFGTYQDPALRKEMNQLVQARYPAIRTVD